MNGNYFKQGNQLLRENKLEKAIAAYKEAIKQNPNIYVYYQNLGEALAKQGKLDEAIANYYCAIEINHNSAYSYNALGEIFIQKGNREEAINAYRMANKIVPNFIFKENLNSLLSKSEGEDNNDSNILALKTTKVSETKPKYYQSYLDLGDEHRRKENADKAVISYLQAVKSKPESYVGYMRLTDLLLYDEGNIQTDTLSQIIQVCLDSIERSKNIENKVYLLIGRSFTKLGQVKKAREYYQKGAYQKVFTTNPDYIQKYWTTGKLKGPDFILIGAPKCGTTTLYQYLSQHPKILPAIDKELNFFNTNLVRQKSEYYFAHFPPIPDGNSSITGEANPSYMYHVYDQSNAVQNIYSILPNIKLIVILRNPIDRAVSQYHHWRKLGLETQSLETVVKAEISELQGISKLTQKIYNRTKYSYLANGLYLFFLQQWFKVFSREQVLILKTEDFLKEPSLIMDKTFDFLKIEKYNAEYKKRYNTGSYDSIDPEMRRRLFEFFQPYNYQLEEYLGREFGWS